jgi:hypothetical protein
MADNNFRSYRSHDPQARNDLYGRAQGTASADPLAELARLIGQSDANTAPPRETSNAGRVTVDDWASDEHHSDERHAGYQDERGDERYAQAPPLAAAPYPPNAAYPPNDAPPSGPYFSGTAGDFTGFREEPDAYGHDDGQALVPARQAQAYSAQDDRYDDPGHQHDGDDAYADEYDDEPARPRRHRVLVMVMAVLGLAVLGTAGAFGYRAMFGGSVLATLPPIIKASNGPNKIMPSYGDAQANNPSQTGSTANGQTELVSREEQPVNIEPPKSAPRVVSTIPIINGQGTIPPGMGAPAAQGQPGANSPANSPWPAAPPVAGAAPMQAQMPVQPPPMQAQGSTPAAAPPAAAAAEPKKIHTVTIRSDQSASADGAAPAPRPARQFPPRTTSAAPPPAGSNAPLSIVPGGQADAAPPPRTRVAAAPMAVASAGAGSASGGGYAVQVSSQRSEGEAHAAFRAMQAKYPGQLGGRTPIIRRADLGDKGTFYRALVGPFASAEEAAGLCSGLKAAGGSCIVQRN